MLLAANLWRPSAGLLDLLPAAALASRELALPAVLGSIVTSEPRLLLVLGFMLTGGSGSDCAVSELLDPEPETRLWDRDRLRSARVPGGDWKLLELLLLPTMAGLMVTET